MIRPLPQEPITMIERSRQVIKLYPGYQITVDLGHSPTINLSLGLLDQPSFVLTNAELANIVNEKGRSNITLPREWRGCKKMIIEAWPNKGVIAFNSNTINSPATLGLTEITFDVEGAKLTFDGLSEMSCFELQVATWAGLAIREPIKNIGDRAEELLMSIPFATQLVSRLKTDESLFDIIYIELKGRQFQPTMLLELKNLIAQIQRSKEISKIPRVIVFDIRSVPGMPTRISNTPVDIDSDALEQFGELEEVIGLSIQFVTRNGTLATYPLDEILNGHINLPDISGVQVMIETGALVGEE